MRSVVPSLRSASISARSTSVAPAASAETFTETVPRLQRAPIEKACGAMEVTATDRNELTATSKCLAAKFRWLNHTVTHPELNHTSYATTHAEIKDNLIAVVRDIRKAKPATSKGVYIRKVTLSSTMGPGVRVDVSTLPE